MYTQQLVLLLLLTVISSVFLFYFFSITEKIDPKEQHIGFMFHIISCLRVLTISYMSTTYHTAVMLSESDQ